MKASTKRLTLSPDQLYDTLQTLVELNELNLRLFEMDGMQEELAACEVLLEFQQLLLDTCFESVH